MSKITSFPGVKDGDIFQIAGMDFIKFPATNGKVPVVMKDIAFRCAFGNNVDFKESEILRRLQKEILPKIIAAVGEENVCTFQTDLTTLDGVKKYGVLESKISIPTMDFYRDNVEIFDKYKSDYWWWLATANSAEPHYDSSLALCVSRAGDVSRGSCNGSYGVRPFLIFESSIFESSEE